MGLGDEPYCRPSGTLMLSRDGISADIASKVVPFWNSRLSAVLERKEPDISRVALFPKRMPLGLSKKRLAVPSTLRVPSMLEALSELMSVTRLKILSTPGSVKVTVAPVSTLKRLKLWKRLGPLPLPSCKPPVIVQSPVTQLLGPLSTVDVEPSIEID